MMKSDGRKDSASFDALWDLDLDQGPEEEIPPALDPRSAGHRDPVGKRDTLSPPMPHGEYVDTMMELGELDDPSPAFDRNKTARVAVVPEAPRARPAEPSDRNKTARFAQPPGGGSLGLVMAPEADLLLPTGGAPAVTMGSQAAPYPAPPSSAQISDASARAPRPGAPRPAPGMPRASAMSGGFRIGPGTPAARPPGGLPPTGLPVPRAPSIPPPAPEPNAADLLDSLDSLDNLFGDDAFAPRAEPELVRTESAIVASPPRRTPTSPKVSRSPSNAGLRLRKTGAPPEPEPEPVVQDRVTPVADEPPPPSVLGSLREMTSRFEAKNYGGALVLAESVLAGDPANAVAKRTAESCREMLGQKYLSSLGGRASIPRVAMSPEEMRSLALDHRAGFLLASVDGFMSIEEILDVSSMPELDALRIMFELRQQGVIEIVEPPRRAGRK